MADVDSGDILRIGCGMIYDGAYDVVNVLHLLATLDTGLTWGTVIGYIQVYAQELYDPLKAQLSDLMGSGSLSVANVTQVTTVGSVAWQTPWVGAVGGDPTASGVCCFGWGRTYKPRVQIRKYFGVFAETGVAEGIWNGTVRGLCEDWMDAHIVEDVMAAGIAFQGVAYNRDLGTYEVAHSVDTSAEPAYQRRRKRGRGS